MCLGSLSDDGLDRQSMLGLKLGGRAADLKVSTGMPLSGWRRKARGVSSSSTNLLAALPRRDRSCSSRALAECCQQQQ